MRITAPTSMIRGGYIFVRLPEPTDGGVDLIDINPNVQEGEPVVHGTRITVEIVATIHAGGTSVDNLGRMYGISAKQVQACIDYMNAPWPRPKYTEEARQ